jgi:hypothetical protein
MKKEFYLLGIVSLFVFGYGCSSDDYTSSLDVELSMEDIHKQIQNQLSALFVNPETVSSGGSGVFNKEYFDAIDQKFQEQYPEEYKIVGNTFEKNRKIASSYDISVLFENNGLDPQLGKYIDFFIENEGQENIYDLFQSKYGVLSEKDASFVFLAVESYKIIENANPGTSLLRSMSAGCIVALAGTVAATVGAITVTSGVGLGIFLVGKALSLVSLGLSCP